MTLQIAGLTAGYSGSRVLDGIDLEVGPGEIVALLGRNGMGKSTLARTLAGSHPSDSGTIVLENERLDRTSAMRRFKRGVRSMRQEKPVITGLTVRENLRLAQVEVADAAALFPFIGERSNQDAGTLSGGEQKLLALARVACNPGKLWVLDEPTEGLQPSNVDRSGQIIREAADAGQGILLIEQHISLALTVADRWVVLEKGTIVESGIVDEHTHARVSVRLTV